MATDLMRRAALAGDVPLLLTIIHDDPTSIYSVQPTSLGDTIAHIAALLGHSGFIKEIVSRNPFLAREVNQQGYSPLHLASDKDQVGVVEELLRAGNDLCLVRGKDGKLPVHVAVMAGKLNVLKKLMEVDPDCLERLTARGETVLHLAVKGNQMQVIQFLAESTLNYSELLNMKDDKGDTALHLAAAGRSKEMTRFLLSRKGIEVNAENKRGETPLGVILSLPPQGGGAAEEVNDIVRLAGGLPTNPRSVIDISLATSATSPSPPAATGRIEESDDRRLKDMHLWLMIVAVVFASISSQARLLMAYNDNIKDSAASAPSVNYSSSYGFYLPNKYLSFRLINLVIFFSSFTVTVMLIMTNLTVKKKFDIFLAKIMQLFVLGLGLAIVLDFTNNKHNIVEEMFIVAIFWTVWFYLTFDAFVNWLASVAGYFVRWLGLKMMMTLKSEFVAFLRGLRGDVVPWVCSSLVLCVTQIVKKKKDGETSP